MLSITAAQRGGGFAATTVYTITAADTFLDSDALLSPCVSGTATPSYHPTLGTTNRVVVTCRVAGHQQGSVSATAYDLAGNRTTAPTTVSAKSQQRRHPHHRPCHHDHRRVHPHRAAHRLKQPSIHRYPGDHRASRRRTHRQSARRCGTVPRLPAVCEAISEWTPTQAMPLWEGMACV